MERVTCSSCKHKVAPKAPRTAWKIASVLFWVAALATGFFFAILLGLNVVLVPAWLGIAMAVGVAARRASAWTCPDCSEELEGYSPQPEPRRPEPMAAPQPA